MTCDDARVLISAAADGQLDAAEVTAMDDHLAGCPSCIDWQDRLIADTRRSTVRSVGGEPAARPASLPDPRQAQRNRMIRIALGWAGVLLVAWHLPEIFSAGSETAIHLARHQAAFAVALGAAFVFVAVRPERAFGVIPFVATFTVALTVTAIVDLVNGSSTLATESRHLLEIGGLVLVWILGVGSGPRKRVRSKPSQRVAG